MVDYFKHSMDEFAVRQLSPLALAHCGDAVFELMVRGRLCTQKSEKLHNLHKETVSYVCAGAQANCAERILPHLSEQELSYYKRGRNANVHTIPKNATHEEYAKATGLECLFGALFLCGKTERLNELFVIAMEDSDAT